MRDAWDKERALKTTLYQKCIADQRLDLLTEWDGEKNAPLSPWTVSYGSKKRVWWRCAKGHVWEAPVFTRSAGHGCPYCKNQKLLKGFNDLAAQYPELAKEWHPTRNGELSPEDVSSGANRKVWWRCARGHEWQAAVVARAAGNGCPICANKSVETGFNDLATLEPELAAQWHPSRNGRLTPEQVGSGSQKKVWWRCEKGHEWSSQIASRVCGGAGCPVCSGKRVVAGENDLATFAPVLAAQWHPTKNAPLTPEQVRPLSNKKVWWRCEKGHEWKTSINHRMRNTSGCPVCANREILAGYNDLATLMPELAAEWHPTLNGALTPQEVGIGTQKRAWWRCAKGHVWKAEILSRAKGGCGCPVCEGHAVVAGENDLATAMPELVKQWHPTKNGELTPDQLRPQSNKSVWWRCELGHEWKANVNSRVQGGSGCPYCTGRKVLEGFNDLATTLPEVAKQWHPTLNGALTPQQVTRGSHRKVWWTCPDGHVWKAMVYSRGSVQKSGCPICAGQGRRSRTLHRYTAADAMLPMAAGADRARISSGWAAPLE